MSEDENDKLQLGGMKDLSLDGLAAETKDRLRQDYIRGVVAANTKAASASVDNVHLGQKLEHFTEHANRATQMGHSASFEDTHRGDAGTTITRISSRSRRDMMMFYIIIGVALSVIVILALVAMHK